jgi:hypothetical protein
MPSEQELIEQIERVLAKFAGVAASWHSSNLASGFRDTVGYAALCTESVALGNYVYGADHPQARRLGHTIRHETLYHLQTAEGILRGTIEALQHGLLTELRTQVLLDVQADFIDAATQALESGGTEAAAVLAAAVLEDSAKRLAQQNDLEKLLDQEFSVVVAELFKAGVISKGTKGVLLGFKDLRNSALHAQWHHVSEDSVRNLLLFLPQFLEQHGV